MVSGSAWRRSSAAPVSTVRLRPSCSAGTTRRNGLALDRGSTERRGNATGSAAPSGIPASVARTVTILIAGAPDPRLPGHASSALRAAAAPARPPSTSAPIASAPPSARAETTRFHRDAPTARRTLISVARADARATERKSMVRLATPSTPIATPSKSWKSVPSAATRASVGVQAMVLQVMPRSPPRHAGRPRRVAKPVGPQAESDVTGRRAMSAVAAAPASTAPVPQYARSPQRAAATLRVRFRVEPADLCRTTIPSCTEGGPSSSALFLARTYPARQEENDETILRDHGNGVGRPRDITGPDSRPDPATVESRPGPAHGDFVQGHHADAGATDQDRLDPGALPPADAVVHPRESTGFGHTRAGASDLSPRVGRLSGRADPGSTVDVRSQHGGDAGATRRSVTSSSGTISRASGAWPRRGGCHVVWCPPTFPSWLPPTHFKGASSTPSHSSRTRAAVRTSSRRRW